MIDRREKNVEIFEDSLREMKNNLKLRQAVADSIRGQKVYLDTDTIILPQNRNLICKTVISKKRSFEAALEYAKAGKKVCVLNFASATNPGGGVTRGSTAQEECLCRCSTLYPCLNSEDMWQLFYKPHRKTEKPLYNDDCVYTPRVTVFKTDSSFPEKMEEQDWYQVDVLTCAAPNLRKKPSNSMNPHAGKTAVKIQNRDLYELLVKRIEHIFKSAVANEAEVLVLGAFGCGAFCNPPVIVARAFRKVQETYAGYFETIEYAIFCRKNETENYDVFCREFPRNRF